MSKKVEQVMEERDFSWALQQLKAGHKVAREGWNGKCVFIFLVPGSQFEVTREPLLTHLGAGTPVTYHPHIDMKAANGEIVPWLASQTDMLANDWGLVNKQSDGIHYGMKRCQFMVSWETFSTAVNQSLNDTSAPRTVAIYLPLNTDTMNIGLSSMTPFNLAVKAEGDLLTIELPDL